MDPVSILAITNASLGITRSLVHTVKELYELAEQYKAAELGIRAVAAQCKSFGVVLERINTWLRRQSDAARQELGSDFWEGLSDNIEVAKLIIQDLDKQISGLKKSPSRLWTRTKFLWNGVLIAERERQMQSLVSAISILLHVIDIPDVSTERTLNRALSQKLNRMTKDNRKWAENLKNSPEDEEGPPVYQATTDDTATAVGNEAQVSDDDVPERVFSSSTDGRQESRQDTGKVPVKMGRLRRGVIAGFRKLSNKTPDLREGAQQELGDFDENKDHMQVDESSSSHSGLSESSDVTATPSHFDQEFSTDSYFDRRPTDPELSLTSSRITDVSSAISYDIPEANLLSQDDSKIQLQSERSDSFPNPYRDLRLSSQAPPTPMSQNENGRFRPGRVDYSNGRSQSTDRFDRIRPARRVLTEKSKTVSEIGDYPNNHSDAITQTNNFYAAKTGFPRTETGFSSSSMGSFNKTTTQRWQTIDVRGQTLNLKVRFERGVENNKISERAAQLLGLTDIRTGPDHNASMICLQMYYPTHFGKGETLLGDRAEFVVMDELESPLPEIILGPNAGNFDEVANGRLKIYWYHSWDEEVVTNVAFVRTWKYFELAK